VARTVKAAAGRGEVWIQVSAIMLLIPASEVYCAAKESFLAYLTVHGSKVKLQTSSDQKLPLSESARGTVCVRLLVRESVEVLGRGGGLPNGPILSGLSRRTFKK
jgi:hypothetical protein